SGAGSAQQRRVGPAVGGGARVRRRDRWRVRIGCGGGLRGGVPPGGARAGVVARRARVRAGERGRAGEHAAGAARDGVAAAPRVRVVILRAWPHRWCHRRLLAGAHGAGLLHGIRAHQVGGGQGGEAGSGERGVARGARVPMCHLWTWPHQRLQPRRQDDRGPLPGPTTRAVGQRHAPQQLCPRQRRGSRAARRPPPRHARAALHPGRRECVHGAAVPGRAARHREGPPAAAPAAVAGGGPGMGVGAGGENGRTHTHLHSSVSARIQPRLGIQQRAGTAGPRVLAALAGGGPSRHTHVDACRGGHQVAGEGVGRAGRWACMVSANVPCDPNSQVLAPLAGGGLETRAHVDPW
ncbi:unnamed protein product, partial [Closterium sp. NIES-54]